MLLSLRKLFFQHFLHFLLGFTLLYTSSAIAQEPTYVVVEDIRVSEEAISVKEAKAKALETAKHAAVMQFLSESLTLADYKRLPSLQAPAIEALILSYDISQDETDGARYKARYSLTLKEREIEELLAKHDILPKKYHKEPILVLPLLSVNGNYILWEGDNPWMDAWNRMSAANPKLFILIPLGDLEDLHAISLSDILARNYAGLGKLRSRYGVNDILLAEAELSEQSLKASLQPIGDIALDDDEIILALTPGAQVTNVMEKMASKALERISVFRKSQENKAERIYSLPVTIKNTSLQELMHIKKMLMALPLIESLTVREISSTKTLIELQHREELATIRAYLDTAGYPISESAEGWVMKR